MTRATKDQIHQLHAQGRGIRDIAREIGCSHTQVRRMLQTPADNAKSDSDGLLVALAEALKSFAIERLGGKWKVVNYDLKLGAKTETALHGTFSAAIREALTLWQ
jgi:hypothetical protein